MADPQVAQDWIEWEGTEMPVPPETPVDVRLADGSVFEGETARDHKAFWSKGLPCSIVEYRVRRMTPLERAARAVREETGAYAHPSGSFMTEGGIVGEQYFRDIARAVLQAIREPSEGMVEAASDRTTLGYDAPPGDVWRVMIGAALEEG